MADWQKTLNNMETITNFAELLEYFFGFGGVGVRRKKDGDKSQQSTAESKWHDETVYEQTMQDIEKHLRDVMGHSAQDARNYVNEKRRFFIDHPALQKAVRNMLAVLTSRDERRDLIIGIVDRDDTGINLALRPARYQNPVTFWMQELIEKSNRWSVAQNNLNAVEGKRLADLRELMTLEQFASFFSNLTDEWSDDKRVAQLRRVLADATAQQNIILAEQEGLLEPGAAIKFVSFLHKLVAGAYIKPADPQEKKERDDRIKSKRAKAADRLSELLRNPLRPKR